MPSYVPMSIKITQQIGVGRCAIENMDGDGSTKQKQAELRSRQGESHEGSAPYRLCIFSRMALVENRESTCR